MTADATLAAQSKLLLSDLELRLMWPPLDQIGPYGAAVQCMLLTAQRARKVATCGAPGSSMACAQHKSGTGTGSGVGCNPRRRSRQQAGVDGICRPRRRPIIAKVPVVDAERRADYVFSLNGRQPLNGWSKVKARLDRQLLAA